MNTKIVVPVVLIVVVVLAAVLFTQNRSAQNTLTQVSPSPTATVEISPSPETPTPTTPQTTDTPESGEPTITTPQPNTKVTSPLTIRGTVPPGWMFEGVVPVKLLDADKKVITQSQGQEVTPGSWSSGKDVEFTATVRFTTSAHFGFIVLEKDNPSGLPENAGSFEIPVIF